MIGAQAKESVKQALKPETCPECGSSKYTRFESGMACAECGYSESN